MADIIGGRIKPGTIIGTDINSGANIPAECMRHSFIDKTDFGITYGSAPTSVTKIIKVCAGDGVVKGFHGKCLHTGSSASITIDLKKNGTTVLSAVITIDNTTGDGVTVDATLNGIPTFVEGDVFTAVIVESSNSGMDTPIAWMTTQETSSPV